MMSEQSGPRIEVSVIVPTFNRKVLLKEALEAICNQSMDPSRYEIIVSDNCSTDNTEEMVTQLAASVPNCIRYHQMPENRGPANSRNTAARLARSEILAFTDSDCRVDGHWLETGLAAFGEERVGLVTGSVYHKPEQTVTYFCKTHDAVTTEHASYPAQNIFFRKSVYFEMGGFDESMCYRDFNKHPVECADTDLAWRIKEAGYESAFRKDMICYHEIERQTPLGWILDPVRLFIVPLLIRKHPQIRSRLLQFGLFITILNPLFYLLSAGLILAAVTAHWMWLLLAAPYILITFRACHKRFKFPLPKLAAFVFLVGVRQAVCCAGLLYGSVRFRKAVL
jgi:glycosyltransferase involved in cell wall biosynthesis